MGYRIFCLCLSLLVLSPVSEVNCQEYRFGRITVDEGLLDNNVYEIFEDNQGLIWIGSARGLQWFNGYDFINFVHDPSDSLSISSGFVRSITQDKDGNMWIGTQNGGLSKFNGTYFENYKKGSNDSRSISHNFVETLLTGKDGTIWIGTWGGGLDLYQDAEFVHVEHVNDSHNNPYNAQVVSLAETSDSTLWVGCWKGGLHKLSSGRLEPVQLLNDHPKFKHKTPRTLLADSQGRLWIGAWGDGLFLLDGNDLIHFDSSEIGLLSDNILSLNEDFEGAIWIGTFGGGIVRIKGETKETITNVHGDKLSLSSDAVECSLVDNNGNLWLGHFNGGVSKCINSGFRSLKHNPYNKNSLPYEKVSAISGDNNGQVWIGTMHGSLSKWKGGLFEHVISGQDPVNNDLSDIRYINTTDLIAIAGHGSWIYYLNQDHWARSKGYEKRQVGVIYKMLIDDNDNDWFCTSEMGLGKISNYGKVKFFNSSKNKYLNISSNDAHNITFDQEGKIWVGTHESGLSVIQNDSVIAHFNHLEYDSSSLDNAHVRSLYCDSAGNIWVGTWGGALNKFHPETNTFIKYFNSSNESDIQSIIEGPGGYLWLGTAQGITRFDPISAEFINLGQYEGVDTYPFMPNSVYYDSVSGNMFFGGENGVTVFNPDQLNLDKRIPKVMLSEVKILGQKIDSLSSWIGGFDSKDIKLSYRENSFSFEYAALNLSANYAYYLDGYEKNWNYAGERKFTSYVNVPSGDYRFRLKAANALGQWSDPVDLLTISITPPFWQTWWFRGLILTVAALIVLAVYEYRVTGIKKINEWQQSELEERIIIQHELETKNAELERFNYTVSHDLKSPLITIKGYLGLIEEDAINGELESLKKDVATVNKAADNMRELLEDLLEYSRLGIVKNESVLIDTKTLVNEVIEIHSTEIEENDVQVVIENQLPTLKGDKTRVAEVFQNLVSNAIKFSKDVKVPKIGVGIEAINGSMVTLYVSDNGVGIPNDYRNKVFEIFERLHADVEGTGIGLTIVKRVVELHGGKVWVESNIGEGSKFLFELPKA